MLPALELNRREIMRLGSASIALGTIALSSMSGAVTGPVKVQLSDAEWRKKLSPRSYAVLRQQATEPPFSSPLNEEHRAGIFACGGCDQRAFSSTTKFESGTGWPSFWASLPRAIATSRDFGFGEERVEVHCSRCGGHLGHVFDDGPKPTGKRYCMNGLALNFAPRFA